MDGLFDEVIIAQLLEELKLQVQAQKESQVENLLDHIRHFLDNHSD